MADLREAHRALLEGIFLFQGAPEAVGAALADPGCTLRQVKKGAVIYDPRRFDRCLGVLLEGEVQVSKGALIISVLHRGELFGAAALFNDRLDYATTLTARTACQVLLLSQELVERLMDTYPAVGRSYVAYLSERIRFLNGKIDALSAGGAECRLAQYLLGQDASGVVELECSATGLARRLNVSRASLYRALDALEASGTIRREGKQIILLDRARLREL